MLELNWKNGLLLMLLAPVMLFAKTPPTGSEGEYGLPVTPPISLSANFAEVRPNHFHGGVDIRMAGRKADIYATADGYISRIGVSPYGFGNVLYLTHPKKGNTISVYGHLREFRKDIQEYVKEQQYAKRSYTVSLFPEAKLFPVKKGEMIAYAGNSGSSQGVHLHYELRTANQDPINLIRGNHIPVTDHIPPTLFKLFLMEVDEVNGVLVHKKKKEYPLTCLTEGKYKVNGDTINITKPAYFALEYIDRKEGTQSRFGIYSMNVSMSGRTIFDFKLDQLNYALMNNINTMALYRENLLSPNSIIRTYIAPNNGLQIYDRNSGDGIIRPESLQGAEKIFFTVTDDCDNVSTLSFALKATPQPMPQPAPTLKKENKIIAWDKGSSIVQDLFQARILPKGLYESELLTVKAMENTTTPYSDKIVIGDVFIPLNKPMTLSIKPKNLPDSLRSKVVIVGLNYRGKPYSIGGVWKDGWVVAETKSMGTFYLSVDNTPPRIKAVSKSGENIAQRGKLSFTISDNLSGIKSWEGLIDGKWALFELDGKNAHLYHCFDAKRFECGKMHTINLVVTDGKGNKSQMKTTYFW